jgi:hypothetical protein
LHPSESEGLLKFFEVVPVLLCACLTLVFFETNDASDKEGPGKGLRRIEALVTAFISSPSLVNSSPNLFRVLSNESSLM